MLSKKKIFLHGQKISFLYVLHVLSFTHATFEKHKTESISFRKVEDIFSFWLSATGYDGGDGWGQEGRGAREDHLSPDPDISPECNSTVPMTSEAKAFTTPFIFKSVKSGTNSLTR